MQDVKIYFMKIYFGMIMINFVFLMKFFYEMIMNNFEALDAEPVASNLLILSRTELRARALSH